MQTHKKFLFYISQNYSFAVLRPIQKQILARGDECIWFVEGNKVDHQFFSATERVVKNVTEVIHYRPDAVFVPGNIVPSFIPGLKIQVWHGLPSSKAKKNGQLYHYIIRGMFDLYCTQGPDSTNKFKELQAQYKTFQVIETGWSKLDPLFQETNFQGTQQKESSTKKSIFFASTFSPRFSKAQMLYPHIIKMINEYDFNWYITLHPKMNQETVNLYRNLESHKVTFVEPTELAQYFKKADMMLCDTSSIIYEFLTLLKPVVTFKTREGNPIRESPRSCGRPGHRRQPTTL